MTERFPPDCSPVSGRFRNTTFICFGPSAASLALRAHSRGLRPPVLVLRLLRWRSALTPGACAPLFWSFDCFAGAPRSLPGLAPPCFGPSAASLALRASGHLARLLRCAARSRPGWRPVWLLRLLRCAARLGSPRSTAPLHSALTPGACAPLFWSFDCFASLRASCHLARLLRFAARSRPGCRPVWLLRLLRCRSAPRVTSLDYSAALRARGRAGAPSGSFGCPLRCAPRVTSLDCSASLCARDRAVALLLLRLLRCAARLAPCSTAPLRCALSPCLLLRLLRCPSASTCVRDFTSDGPVLRWRAQRRTVFPARSIHF